jgi:hypothetical protein
MPQTIHILLKDARRNWAYIAVVLAITAVLTVLTPRWVPVYGRETKNLNGLVDILGLLLPVAWWFTIAHLIHGEALVGDRQFWVTRPYSWKSLLAAKFLFCVVFLAAPHLVFDWIVLSVDGFSPQSMIPGLLWRQCSLFGVPMLPALVLAAVTRNMRQFALVSLALAIAFAGLTEVEALHPSNAIVTALANGADLRWSETIWYAGGAMALLLWLYARRRTGAARAIVAAVLVWGLVESAWAPPAIAWAAQNEAAPAEHPEIAVVFAPQRGGLGMFGASGVKDKVQVDIPIELTGCGRDLLDVEMASVSILPEHGAAWSSAWNWYVNASKRRGQDWIEMHLEPRVFQRLSGGPVKVRAVFGVVVYETETTTRFAPGGGWTNVPGFGKIAIRSDSEYPSRWWLWWRAPLRDPQQKFIYTVRDPDSGVVYRGEHSRNYPPTVTTASIRPEAFFASSPDERVPLDMEKPLSKNARCEFTVERPIALIRRDLEIPNIRLGDYKAGDADRMMR